MPPEGAEGALGEKAQANTVMTAVTWLRMRVPAATPRAASSAQPTA